MALKKEQIITEALQLLNENGLEGVTLRKLALKLNVQAPALYWHFKNKNALINDMAEALLQKEFTDKITWNGKGAWQDWLCRIFKRLRQALCAYTDGGRVVAGAHLTSTMAHLSEETIKALIQAGIEQQEARLIVLTATRFTFGHVIEEQTTVTQKEIKGFHFDDLAETHPTLTASIKAYFSAGKSVEDLFNDGLRLIIR